MAVTVQKNVAQVARVPTQLGPKAPVPISQIEWEFANLLRLYKLRKPRRVLELGTFTGGSLYHWLQNAEPDTHVVTIDWLKEAPDNRPSYQAWCPPGVKLNALAGDTHDPEIQHIIKGYGPYDWIFIDAMHTYDAAKADWDDYRPMASEEAIVAFHDVRLRRFYPESGKTAGVLELWREIQAEGYVTQELVCHPGQVEFGIGVVYLGGNTFA